jgi:hypothetical protein
MIGQLTRKKSCRVVAPLLTVSLPVLDVSILQLNRLFVALHIFSPLPVSIPSFRRFGIVTRQS